MFYSIDNINSKNIKINKYQQEYQEEMPELFRNIIDTNVKWCHQNSIL